MTNPTLRKLQHFTVLPVGIVLLFGIVLATGAQVTATEKKTTEKQTAVRQPKFTRATGTSYDFDGFLDDYLVAVSENWLKKMPDRNPGVLGMFTEEFRNTPYVRHADESIFDYRKHTIHEWSGDYAGKYLTGAVQILRLTGERGLRNYLERFVRRLISYQTEDGYLGPWPKEYQLTGNAPNLKNTWDAWGHYHVMVGLLLWHEETGDAEALQAAERIADLMCEVFLGKPGGILRIGTANANLAPVHALGILYRKTGTPRYLALARQIVDDEFPRDADYIGTILGGKEYYQVPTKFGARWESVHALMGIVELYWITGDEKYRDAFERLWWSMLKTDRKNNGAYSTWERAFGDPYNDGAAENCCTIAWAAMSSEMLKLTGNSVVADELELTLINAGLGYQPRSGTWHAYNSPMDGAQIPFITFYPWHPTVTCREVTCCTANSPRNLGIVSDWALMRDDDGLILNWYGPSTMKTTVKGVSVTLIQKTVYPRSGSVQLEVSPSQSVAFDLKLRIPYWSQRSQVAVNNAAPKTVAPGGYFLLRRNWKPGDKVSIDLDVSLHYWAGRGPYDGKAAIYHGPVLLAYNPVPTDFEESNITWKGNWEKAFGLYFSSQDAGDTLTYAFEGDRICWIGFSHTTAGKAAVEIDGKQVATVDQYAKGSKGPFVWKRDGLGDGKHQLAIMVLGERGPKSRGDSINVKGFAQSWPDIPTFDARHMKARLIEGRDAVGSIVRVELSDVNDNKVVLCDYDSAGENGEHYISWLNVRNVPKIAFSQSNPLRSGRVESGVSVGD